MLAFKSSVILISFPCTLLLFFFFPRCRQEDGACLAPQPRTGTACDDSDVTTRGACCILCRKY